MVEEIQKVIIVQSKKEENENLCTEHQIVKNKKLKNGSSYFRSPY